MVDDMAKDNEERDLGLLLGVAWLTYTASVRQRLAAAGYADIRSPDGALFRLLHRHEDISVTEIGRLLGVTKQAASKIIDSLERRRYVFRERSAADSRERHVRLTERGKAVRARAIAIAGEIEAELRLVVGEEAVNALQIALTALSDSVEDGDTAARKLRAGMLTGLPAQDKLDS